MSHRSKQGTTHFPAILKKPVTAREVFETLGFDKVNIELLRRIGYEIAEADLDASFADFAASIKQLGEYADDANSLKNRLKHSKAVFGVDFGLEEAAEVAHLEIADEKPNTNGAATAPPLVRFWRREVTDEQARTALLLTAKIANISLDLLAIFVAQYYSEADAERIGRLVKGEFEEIVAAVRADGLLSKGLTD